MVICSGKWTVSVLISLSLARLTVMPRGEEIEVFFSGDTHTDDLAADFIGQGLLRPGELIHGNIDFITHIPSQQGNGLMREGKGVKGAGEKGVFADVPNFQLALGHFIVPHKPIDVIKGRCIGNEGQGVGFLLSGQDDDFFSNVPI